MNKELKRPSCLPICFTGPAGQMKHLHMPKKADSIAEKAHLYDLQARVCGLISTIYRTSRLPVQGKIYLKKALKASKKIVTPDESLRFQGNLHQEMAYYEMDDNNYAEAVKILRQGKSFFEKISSEKEKNFLLATNEELIAKNYVLLNQFDEALNCYKKGLGFLKESEVDSALKGFIYNGMGNVFLAENENKEAIRYYTEALHIAEISQFVALKEEVYKSLTTYYKATKDQENYVKYSEKYLELRDNNEQANMLSANRVVRELRSKEKSAVFNFYTIASISSILILIAFGAYFYMSRKRKKEKMHFNQIINDLKQKTEKKDILKSLSSLQENDKELLPAETERKILRKLEGFEESTKYLEKGFTLSGLAVELETNTKYLSHIIKKHKQCDFNTYMNKLKINYIINKFHDEPVYSNYKISYLADICGFSSHSKFTNIFKNITGVSPTVFISLLAEQGKDKS